MYPRLHHLQWSYYNISIKLSRVIDDPEHNESQGKRKQVNVQPPIYLHSSGAIFYLDKNLLSVVSTENAVRSIWSLLNLIVRSWKILLFKA